MKLSSAKPATLNVPGSTEGADLGELPELAPPGWSLPDWEPVAPPASIDKPGTSAISAAAAGPAPRSVRVRTSNPMRIGTATGLRSLGRQTLTACAVRMQARHDRCDTARADAASFRA